MFYAHFVLSKKGPLARIWLAAHWDKKLTKAHVFETNIEGSVEAIIQPKVKLALRTSGHLLLGVVRIYSRKAKYLLADCNEAFVKIKMAFRPGVVDLPEENREAAVAAITLPETFHDFDTTMADLTDIDVQAQFTVNQSRPEEITMREDLGNITLVGEDGFGDMGFGTGDNMLQDVHMDDTLFVKNPDQILNEATKPLDQPGPMDIDLQPRDDAFADGLADYEGPAGADDDDDDNDVAGDFGGGLDTGLFDNLGAGLFIDDQPEMTLPPPVEDQAAAQPPVLDKQVEPEKEMRPEDNTTHIQEQTTIREQSTLIPNEAEAFALEPIDVTSIGTERRTKRKRKLVIDEQKGIPSETMKMQLSDTSEIIATLDLAPPTKKLMHWKETGGVEKLFALPGRALVSKRISKLFNRNLVTKSIVFSEADQLGLELEHGRDDDTESNVTAEVARDAEVSSIAAERYEEPPSLIQETPRRSEEPSLISANDPSLNSTVLQREDVVAEVSGIMAPPRRMSSDDDNDFAGGFDEDSLSPPPQFEQEEEVNEELQALPEDDALLVPGETEEEYEERRWKGRTQQMMHMVSRGLQKNTAVSFFNMISRNNRKQVASKFYTLLVLKKIQAIEVEQLQPFGDITVTAGPKAALVC